MNGEKIISSLSFLSFLLLLFFFSVCLQRMKGWTELKYEKRFSE